MMLIFFCPNILADCLYFFRFGLLHLTKHCLNLLQSLASSLRDKADCEHCHRYADLDQQIDDDSIVNDELTTAKNAYIPEGVR